MGISQNTMARAIGVAPQAIKEIVHGKRSITPSMTIRLGAFFGESDTLWHGIQAGCGFRALAKDREKLSAGIKPVATDCIRPAKSRLTASSPLPYTQRCNHYVSSYPQTQALRNPAIP